MRNEMERGMTRRSFAGAAAALGGLFVAGCSRREADAAAEGEAFEVTKTPEEWRRILTPEQYRVLRRAGTERSGSSPLDREHRKGIFACAGCDLPLYRSEAKYESGTGWPSFTAPIEGAVRTRPDDTLFMTRTEVHCRRCGGHLGHVFDDGPPPAYKRYCMNGVAMRFHSAQSAGA
jgi:peptide-methionine (R)-S-oxide reductase